MYNMAPSAIQLYYELMLRGLVVFVAVMPNGQNCKARGVESVN